MWCEHADITGVMLATSLAPEGFLELDTHGKTARYAPDGHRSHRRHKKFDTSLLAA